MYLKTRQRAVQHVGTGCIHLAVLSRISQRNNITILTYNCVCDCSLSERKPSLHSMPARPGPYPIDDLPATGHAAFSWYRKRNVPGPGGKNTPLKTGFYQFVYMSAAGKLVGRLDYRDLTMNHYVQAHFIRSLPGRPVRAGKPKAIGDVPVTDEPDPELPEVRTETELRENDAFELRVGGGEVSMGFGTVVKAFRPGQITKYRTHLDGNVVLQGGTVGVMVFKFTGKDKVFSDKVLLHEVFLGRPSSDKDGTRLGCYKAFV